MPWFEHWLARAKQGDDFAAALTWSSLLDAVEHRHLTADQWNLISELLHAIVDSTDRKAGQAVNSALSLGRRPGRRARYEVEEDRFARATAVFEKVGVAKGDDLAQACAEVLTDLGIGSQPNAADVRSTIKAYREHLPLLVELRALSRNDQK